ncbi:UDP-glycosyltransferase UGT5-like [Frankliniella occidentalis]|uniref:UDP-glucuronosyltransferase n=1 Tax=Frankliniella occidentalis TaxID=133901 RepID=A0A9C6XB40_FRAOC|nr:UDP-glycosyltransferase UGT5-like [Frankliniella occidentalis]
MKALLALLLVVAASSVDHVDAARILAVFPHTGKTHFLVFEPLLKELAARGHEMVVVSHFPQKVRPSATWTDISLEGTLPNLAGVINLEDGGGLHPLTVAAWDFWFVTQFGHYSCDTIYAHPPLKKLVDGDRRGFDLIINENFNTNCFLGLVHRFRPAPYVAFSSCAPFSWDYHRVGNPYHGATMPNTFLWLSDEMSFTERAVNTVFSMAIRAYQALVWDRDAQRVVEKHLGPGVPPLIELANNMSVMLSNTHAALNRAKPLVPAVVEVGGIHIDQPKPLPQDLEQFVSGAKDGVILFSLGSMIRASSLPKENAAALLRGFGTLKQRVVWKWEDEAPGPVPKNVRLSKWLPQFDVLCHNNTRLFIGHGGLLSTSEAAHCGVPLLGIAMYGDQRTNLAAVAKAGAGRSLPYSTLKNADLFLKNVKDLLEDPSFQQSATALSERFRDRPMSPLDTAVYWTEYVIRHKGAPHLRGAARNLTWYQEALLDVFAVVFLCLAAALYVAWTVVRTLLRLVMRVGCSLTGACDQKAAPKKKKQ